MNITNPRKLFGTLGALILGILALFGCLFWGVPAAQQQMATIAAEKEEAALLRTSEGVTTTTSSSVAYPVTTTETFTDSAELGYTPLDLDPNQYDAVLNVKGDLPMLFDFRTNNRKPGDVSRILVTFSADFDDLTILRMVCDDFCVSIEYYDASEVKLAAARPSDILSLFGMTPVGAESLKTLAAESDLAQYMALRGVQETEILDQNKYAVHVGPVRAGATYLVITMGDNPDLDVNNGGMLVFSRDTDPYTVELSSGEKVASPSFVIPSDK